MVDILEFIEDLKELQELYNTGELRNFDFAIKIQNYERQVAQFESAMEQENTLFWEGTPFYNPVKEV
jgi:hypothetical protein